MIILFIQDDTNEHIKSYSFFYDITTKIIDTKLQYETSWRKGGKIIKRTIASDIVIYTLPSAFSIRETCEKFNIYMPKSYNTLCLFYTQRYDYKRSKDLRLFIKMKKMVLFLNYLEVDIFIILFILSLLSLFSLQFCLLFQSHYHLDLP